jgi:hypothetical protein
MSIQTIIDNADTIQINRRRQVGVQFSRSEIAYTSETATRNPWRMTVKVARVFKYDQARSLMETIDKLDRTVPETVSFSNNANLDWMWAYQGECTGTQLGNIQVSAFSGNQLTLKTLSSISSGKLIFAQGDIIQIEGYPYPFTVVDALYRNSSATQTVTVHRPNFITASVVNAGIIVGNAVQFRVFCPNMPTYTIKPGGNTALVEFDTEFNLYEYTGNA